ncbi:MAG: hypothetical protein ACRD5H_11765 [Nitrososphaerales archaeon]
MGLASGLIPEAFFRPERKEDVIRHLINSPVPLDIKEIALTEWAKEVGVTLTEQDRKRLGVR